MYSFNPTMVFLNYGSLIENQLCYARMCYWYEIELISDAKPDSGVFTNGEFIPAKKGLIYIRKPGDIVEGIAGKGYSYNAVAFDSINDTNLASRYAEKELSLGWGYNESHALYMQAHPKFDFLDKLPNYIFCDNISPYLEIFREIMLCAFGKSGSVNELMLKGLLFMLISKINSQTEIPDNQSSATGKIINDIVQYITDHYAEPLCLDDLARIAMMSREYLVRSFHKQVGVSPMDYVQKIRLYHAKRRMLTSDDSISQIISDCGFSSEQYFYKLFKRSTNLTPNNFRKQGSNTYNKNRK